MSHWVRRTSVSFFFSFSLFRPLVKCSYGERGKGLKCEIYREKEKKIIDTVVRRTNPSMVFRVGMAILARKKRTQEWKKTKDRRMAQITRSVCHGLLLSLSSFWRTILELSFLPVTPSWLSFLSFYNSLFLLRRESGRHSYHQQWLEWLCLSMCLSVS